jgi:hypothetical protein
MGINMLISPRNSQAESGLEKHLGHLQVERNMAKLNSKQSDLRKQAVNFGNHRSNK